MDVWQWTLTKDAVAPCFVRDVLDMRQASADTDFFWLGHTPCRTVVVVGMVVAVQVYDRRAIYTIDDGTAVIDCVFRYPHPPRSPPKNRPDTGKAVGPIEPPPPVTEPGYPVRVVGRVARHYESKQIHADSIDPCPSSLDEITHLEHVIQLHKTKYSFAVPFQIPSSKLHAPLPDPSAPPADAVTVFSSRAGPSTAPYVLPAPPLPLQNRSRIPSAPTHNQGTHHGHTHVPSSPTASSIVSSTPSSPSKSSSPVRPHEIASKPKLRHPSRLHGRDLTANTFRLYVKHYMDNAPPPFSALSWSSSSLPLSVCGNVTTPTRPRYSRFSAGSDEREGDDATPRPRPRSVAGETKRANKNVDDADGPTLGFTLSHLRRVPELALLAARVVRAETRRRDKAERDKAKGKAGDSQRTCSTSMTRPSGGRVAATDSPRKKMKRLFAWAVVKLYEEGSIVLWDGEVRPLPVPPLAPLEGASTSGVWSGGTVDPSASVSTCGSSSSRELYNMSASASLYSHHRAPRGQDGKGGVSMSEKDGDVDPAELSDPGVDEEAYVPLNPRFLAEHVREALTVLRRGRCGAERGTDETAKEVLASMQRADGRWARVGVWAIEEALAVVESNVVI